MKTKSAFKLRFEVIPASASGRNLRSAVGAYCWRKVRLSLLGKSGGICEICGRKDAKHAHESWNFDDTRHGMSLASIDILCLYCHYCMHFGLAEKMQYEWNIDIDGVITHFMKVNGWNRKQLFTHCEASRRIGDRRSRHEWCVDYGSYSKLVNDVDSARADRFRKRQAQAALKREKDAFWIDLAQEREAVDPSYLAWRRKHPNGKIQIGNKVIGEAHRRGRWLVLRGHKLCMV